MTARWREAARAAGRCQTRPRASAGGPGSNPCAPTWTCCWARAAGWRRPFRRDERFRVHCRTLGLFLLALVGMEGWPGPPTATSCTGALWVLHRSHHEPRSGRFELNDLFADLSSPCRPWR